MEMNHRQMWIYQSVRNLSHTTSVRPVSSVGTERRLIGAKRPTHTRGYTHASSNHSADPDPEHSQDRRRASTQACEQERGRACTSAYMVTYWGGHVRYHECVLERVRQQHARIHTDRWRDPWRHDTMSGVRAVQGCRHAVQGQQAHACILHGGHWRILACTVYLPLCMLALTLDRIADVDVCSHGSCHRCRFGCMRA